MSKSLTTEYKTVMQEEVPDLWARIEASLPEKELSKKVVSIEEARDKKVAELETKRKKNKKIMKFVYSMSGVAVAGIAIAVLIPFIADSNARNNAAIKATQSKESFAADNAGSNKSENAFVNEMALADTEAEESYDDYAYRADVVAGGIAEPGVTVNDAVTTESDSALLTDCQGVTIEYLGNTKVSGIEVAKIKVTECESNPELEGMTLYVDNIEDAESVDGEIFDLTLDVQIDGVNIYSID